MFPKPSSLIKSQRFVVYNTSLKAIVSPRTNAVVLKVIKASNKSRAYMDSTELSLRRVRVSTKNFISLARLHNLPVTPDAKIKLVSIPQVILAIAMRDLSQETTDVGSLILHD
jgi:hypothetical protein